MLGEKAPELLVLEEIASAKTPLPATPIAFVLGPIPSVTLMELL
jgi:hypothetical protein